eukprot:UN04601
MCINMIINEIKFKQYYTFSIVNETIINKM